MENASDFFVIRTNRKCGADEPCKLETKADIELLGSSPYAAVERKVRISGVPDEFTFGIHPVYAQYYGFDPDQYRALPTTNDMLIASVATCLTGTFVTALERRGVQLERDQFRAEVKGDVGPVDGGGPWIVRSIEVDYEIILPEADHAVAEHVHSFYQSHCWLSQTMKGARCRISSRLHLSVAPAVQPQPDTSNSRNASGAC